MAPRYDIDSFDNRDPAVFERVAKLIEHTIVPYHRAETRGVERIPEGAALYVGNHNSFAYAPEMYLLALAAYRRHGVDAVPYGLAHEVVLALPGVSHLICPLGAVRASPQNGQRLLESGHKVLVYPGGDIDAARPFRHRNRIVFGDRRGYIRLALRTGAPIVPVVTAGAHATTIVIDDLRWLARLIRADRMFRLKVWPLTLSFPWGITLGPPPPFIPFPSRITMEFLEPIQFERTGPEAADDADWVERCADRVRHAMQDSLTRLASERDR
jgi:1-acyl-sn-glycerol-3-phosphate acyltransferase